MRRRFPLGALAPLLLAALFAAVATPTAAATKVKDLPEKYQEWLAEVEYLIPKAERREFLELEKDYQRDAFIERFWAARDPYPDTARNEFREVWQARREYALETFGNTTEDRARILLVNGEPTQIVKLDCPWVSWPLEIWRYLHLETVPSGVSLIFYRAGASNRLRLWQPRDGIRALGQEPIEMYSQSCPGVPSTPTGRIDQASTGEPATRCFLGRLKERCELHTDDFRAVEEAFQRVLLEGPEGFALLWGRLAAPPRPRESEWLLTFNAWTTDLPPDAETLEAAVEIAFPGKDSFRTVLQTLVTVPADQAIPVDLAGRQSYNFLLTGEVLRGGSLFESFRYKFDQPVADAGTIPLLFQRALRPDSYELVLKLEDLNSGRFFRHQQALEVPRVDEEMPVAAAPAEPLDPTSAAILEGARRALEPRALDVELVKPDGDVHLGMTRFDTLTRGEDAFAKATFFLNGRALLSKKRPPFSVELDLGKIPRRHRVRVEVYDAAGERLASDELELNSGPQRFTIRLLEPKAGQRYDGALQAKAEVETPQGVAAERVEFYLDETLLSTLYQPPYVQPVVLDPAKEGELTYVRAVAYLEDGLSAEDVVFVNSPDFAERVDVQFLEVYAAVADRDGRPIEGLEVDDFRVIEDGVVQRVSRFEQVENLPIHVGVLLDTSASMEESLRPTRDAALGFFEATLKEEDRGAVITFNDQPHLVAELTGELETLASQLAGLKAERGTALWDSLVFSLYYFNGVRGQRALLLLSDGKDESSRHTYDEALSYAQTAGVTLYTIGLGLPRTQIDVRRQLSRLAEQTGGRGFFIDRAEELPAIYTRIEKELRSRYLLAYQSSATTRTGAFRTVEVTIPGKEYEIQALRGYYP